MGIRLTGFSTPVIGAEWEYTDKKKTVEETTPSLKIESCHKIKVFISSRHGDNGKYDRVRSQLKKTIEETGLAYVYTFEQEAASTLTVRNHFSWVLEDSDLCIFLIDNADGVSISDSNDCRICDLKREFNSQINASSTVVFVVGDMTKYRIAGSGCDRNNKKWYECYCTPYKQNINGKKLCK